jgi:hypothetical protein
MSSNPRKEHISLPGRITSTRGRRIDELTGAEAQLTLASVGKM